jgi:phage shock protein A
MLERILDEIQGLRGEVRGLSDRVDRLKTSFGQLRAEVGELRAEVNQVKVELAEFRAETRQGLRDLDKRFARSQAETLNRYVDLEERVGELEQKPRG